MQQYRFFVAALTWVLVAFSPSVAIGQVPPLPQRYVGIQSAGLGEAFSFEVSADGSHVARIIMGWNCPDRFPVTINLAPNVLPINIDENGRFRFSGRDIPVGVSDTLGIEGVFFDADGFDGNAEQALGGLLLTRGASSCIHRWWATPDPDSDLDGWNNRAEIRLGSGPSARPSTPEHREVPAGLPLATLGPCFDSVDNDLDGVVDVADSGCGLPACIVVPSYTAGTLRLDFTIGNPNPTEWHVAVLAFGRVFTFWRVALPSVDPAASFTVPIPGFPNIGTIGLLSTLTSGTDLVCTDLRTVDTTP